MKERICKDCGIPIERYRQLCKSCKRKHKNLNQQTYNQKNYKTIHPHRVNKRYDSEISNDPNMDNGIYFYTFDKKELTSIYKSRLKMPMKMVASKYIGMLLNRKKLTDSPYYNDWLYHWSKYHWSLCKEGLEKRF